MNTANDPIAITQRAITLFEQGQVEASMTLMRQQVKNPQAEPHHYTNLGFVLKRTNDMEEAERIFSEGLQRFPDSAELHWHRALLLLQTGRFLEGLQEYEWRWRVAHFPSRPRNFPQPLWDGSPQRNKTLLVYAEQGFGDTLQFMRYLPFAARLTGQLIFEVQPELYQLIAHQRAAGLAIIPPDTFLVATGQDLPPFDDQIPLLSLPLALGLHDFTRPPMAGAYLAAPCGLQRKPSGNVFSETINTPSRRKVGFVWTGRPTYPHNAARSFNLEDCAPLWDVEDITWLSLQIGVPASLRDNWKKTPLIDMSSYINDFFDTARIVRGMDLLISTDTSVAHLAAAMGIPTWIPTVRIPDWRWGLQGEHSPWYEAVSLFRQRESGVWSSVFVDMARQLRDWA